MRKRRIRHAKLNENIVAESPEFQEPSDVKGMKRPPGEAAANVKAATRRKVPLLKVKSGLDDAGLGENEPLQNYRDGKPRHTEPVPQGAVSINRRSSQRTANG